MEKSAGLIGLGGYLPAKEIPREKHKAIIDFLKKETLLYPEYIEAIVESGRLPGSIETNYDGWESQPWYQSWLDTLPSKKRDNPFQGTKERRRVPLDPVSLRKSTHPHPMLSSDAETLAGAMAIFNSGIDKDEIDLVLCSSLVPDLHVPLNASLVQHKLGLHNAAAYNVDTCCSSFITMMEVAMSYVRSGIKKKVLVIGSAIDSHINDKCSYFSVYVGDGAAAGIVTEVDDEYGYISSYSLSRGNRHKAIVFTKRKPNLHLPLQPGPTYEQEYVTFHDPEMCKEVARHAENDMADAAQKALAKANLTADDLDFLITHQPVPWTPHAWRKAIGVPESKFYQSFEKYGNIAVAAAPTNLLEAVELGLIKAGDRVMIASSGVGENHIVLIQTVPPKLIESNRL